MLGLCNIEFRLLQLVQVRELYFTTDLLRRSFALLSLFLHEWYRHKARSIMPGTRHLPVATKVLLKVNNDKCELSIFLIVEH